MALNKVSASLDQTTIDGILADIDTLEAKLPFLISLTEKEKDEIPPIGPNIISFLNESVGAAKQNPGMMPGDFDLNELIKDVNLITQMGPIVSRYSALYEKLMDTYKEVLAESYAGGLAVYAMAKFRGKNLGGMDATLDNLGKRFAKKTGKTTPPANQ